MKIINTNERIPYPPLLDWSKSTPPDGWAEFPEKFVPIFYPEDKQAAGFVDITVESGMVTSCAWNEEAYQAYISSLPDPSTDPAPTTEGRVAALESENKTLKAQVSAQSEQMDFYEECIAEMASVVYA